MTERLLSIDEAAERLAIGRSMAKSLIGAGKIKTVKLGTRRLIAERDLGAFIAALERQRV